MQKKSIIRGEKMTTREKVLELFEKNKGSYFSGEELAQRIHVSRAAVWKAVNSLRQEGYCIDAVTNKGYCLSAKTDILSPQGIYKYLNFDCPRLEIVVLPTVASTNTWIKEKANLGLKEGYILIANEQTNGRGRRGRDFFSPSETGIYMSLLLRPKNYSAGQAVRLTTMAAVAMCEAIETVSGEAAGIKWVNDIYMRGKKVCGILTEASFDLESGLLEYAVLGVGVNVYCPGEGFPKQLRQIAGSVLHTTMEDAKNRLAGTFLNCFMKYYTCENPAGYIKQYQNRNLAVGKQVMVLSGDKTARAFAYGVDEECRLLVEYEDGRKESLSYGEIDVKLG